MDFVNQYKSFVDGFYNTINIYTFLFFDLSDELNRRIANFRILI